MSKDFFDRIENKQALVEAAQYLVTRRHWGFSIVLDANTRIHSAKGEPSVHFHRYRTEDYILYSGEMIVYRGKYWENDLEKTVANLEPVKLIPGDKVVMPPNTVHIPISLGDEPAVFIEISHGPYEESDIERIYDKNARDPELVKRWSALGYEPGVSVVDLVEMIKRKLKK